ncbi:MAG: transporter [Betaproteobacteria bacterium]|nr:transporter [Betaproteobacteria bacterium]
MRTLPIVYTRGLTETLDVFAGLSHARARSSTGGGASGAGNPSFGIKWRFYENEETKTSFALKPEVLFPVSAGFERAGLGKGRTSGGVALILTQEVPFGALHVNVGVGHDGYREASNNPDTTTARASFAPVWDLSAQWKLAFDVGTESAHAAGAKVRANFIELGAIYSPSKDLDFALGILRSSDSDNPRATKHTATTGITWRFQ